MSWYIQLTNIDGSRYGERSKPFMDEFAVFESLRQDFSDVKYIKQVNNNVVLYDLYQNQLPGRVRIAVFKES